MKHVLLTLSFLWIYSAQSQDTLETEKKRFQADAHWAGFEFGTLILTTSEYNRNFGEYDFWGNEIQGSSAFNINFFEYKFPIFKQYLGLTTGLGYTLNSIGLRGNYRIQHNMDTVFATQNLFQAYTTNTLDIHLLSVPLLLEFATAQRQKKSFYFNAGIIASLRIGSNTVQTGEYSNGDRFNLNVRSRFNLLPYSLEATVRTGFSHFGIFASYNLTSLFKENKTIGVFPFRAGLSLNISLIDFD